MSLDGFVAGPNGETDWMLRRRDVDGRRWLEETLWRAGLHIMGSRTYLAMREYWPNSTERMAVPMNTIPKAVFTRQQSFDPDADRSDNPSAMRAIHSAGWDTADVLQGDLASEIGQLKQQSGKAILAHGGTSFAQSLVACGLIDEYRLLIHPVVLGEGRSLFAQVERPLDLKLRATTSFRSGVVANVYSPE